MPTVTPPPSVSPVAAALNTTSGSSVTPVETTLGNTPDKIQQLDRQIQVSGTIIQPTDGSSVTLSTVLGELKVVLPVLTQEQQDKLIQQLTALFQNQKPLTVLVQPGDPPTQAFILLPSLTATSSANPTTSSPTTQPNVFQQGIPLPPLTAGAVLPAVVLPPNTTLTNPINNPLPLGQANTPLIQTPISPASLQTQPLGHPPLLTAPTEAQLAILTDLSVLDELASKAEDLMRQMLPELEAKLFSGTSLSQNLPQTVPAIPATPGQPLSQVPPGVVQSPVITPAETLGTLTPQAASNIIPTTPFASPSPTALPPLTTLLQPGTEVSLQINAVALPGASPLVPVGPNQILATVTGTGPNGQLLVQSGNSALYVKQSGDVPVGSNLLITVQPGRPEPLIPLPLPDTNNFASLQQALNALAQVDPLLARQVMESVIPQPNTALGGALLFMLNAFGQGNLRDWLGNSPVDILSKTGKIELIAKLTQQLSQGGQIVNDPVVGAWRSYMVPLHAENQFQTLHLYVHKDANNPSGKDDKRDTGGRAGPNTIRFLIDMRLSKIGAMQLDGFVRPKQLDMIIRSERNLPEGLHENLRLTYIKSLEAVGYVGTLNFQTGHEGWLNLGRASGSRVM